MLVTVPCVLGKPLPGSADGFLGRYNGSFTQTESAAHRREDGEAYEGPLDTYWQWFSMIHLGGFALKLPLPLMEHFWSLF